ncbi:hypothetical protein PLICRDRAFT_673196 [Plicaturopsis crispa FD-325 SS-3]|nr:hypothetical protein PLICRDRAFT_673196 [Plicaturopsis crispa FD-325 SS-3]
MRSTTIIFTVLAASLQLAAAAPWPLPRQIMVRGGDAYTGAGGKAPGGSVVGSSGGFGSERTSGLGSTGGLVDLFSDNAGQGGDASSGPAGTGRRIKFKGYKAISSGGGSGGGGGGGSGSNAYTGVGGSAPGGSVDGKTGGLVELFSGNAGQGGEAGSGPSVGRRR